jgi:hypothetical protein
VKVIVSAADVVELEISTSRPATSINVQRDGSAKMSCLNSGADKGDM